MNKSFLFFLISLVLSTFLYSQTVDIKDGSSNTLLQINDEGTTGSITIPSGAAPDSASGKLYNFNGALYWSNSPLAYNYSHNFSAYLTQNLSISSEIETQLTDFTEYFDSGNGIHSDGLFLPSAGIFTVPQTGIYHFDFSVSWKFQNPNRANSSTIESPISILIKHSYNDHGTPIEKFYRLNHFVHLYDYDLFDGRDHQYLGTKTFNETVMFSTNIKASINDIFTFFVWYENSETFEIVGGNSGEATTMISAFKVN